MASKDFKSLHLDIPSPSDHAAASARRWNSIRTAAGVRHCLEKGIPEEVLQNNVWMVSRWLEEMEKCQGCRGLEECRQAQKGYTCDLSYDGILQKNLVACMYLKKQNEKRKHLSGILINEMPESLYEVSFEGIDLDDPANKDASYQRVLMKAWHAAQDHKGLFLYGGMGTGKSYLAACALNLAAKQGDRCAFVVWPDFVSEMAASIRSGEYREKLDLLSYVPFLVIDDIGAEKVTEWNRDELLFPLLNRRCDSHRTTWFTSNDDLKRLEDHFAIASSKQEELKAKRIVERIHVLAEAEALTGKDRRKTID